MRSTRTIAALLGAAVLALAAVAPACAGAAQYHSEVSTTYLTAEQVVSNVFTVAGGSVKCGRAKLVGEFTGESVPTLTVTPTYSECVAFGVKASVEANGCAYRLMEPFALLSSEVQIICPTGKEIVIKAIAPACTVKIAAQTVGNVVLTNEGVGTMRDLRLTWKVGTGEAGAGEGYEYISSGGICGASGIGKYSGASTMKGYSNPEHTSQRGIWAS